MAQGPLRRVKSYSAETGIVYQYVFIARRHARRGWFTRGAEYLFDISSDRKTNYAVPVFLSDEAVRTWERKHGRELSSTECYAAAKMRLFRAFDQVENLEREAGSVSIGASNIEELLAALDIV